MTDTVITLRTLPPRGPSLRRPPPSSPAAAVAGDEAPEQPSPRGAALLLRQKLSADRFTGVAAEVEAFEVAEIFVDRVVGGEHV
ncbi:hypothetical protein Aau02nite_20990 [Amorphoplanes auranticolor]|uniref:Uncharacterized protein n=1 Tax=Actinoplanes auranticolor TaxID=47988 RepID=A0A919S6S2_9ACTN|nr:hypothetical protein Aau02nite_20990 [Actinoplanes auranticolor]